jgi:hypothetical protein
LREAARIARAENYISKADLLRLRELLKAGRPKPKRGFSVIDVTPDKVTFTVFMWRPPQPVEEIDTMKPAIVYEVPRKA